MDEQPKMKKNMRASTGEQPKMRKTHERPRANNPKRKKHAVVHGRTAKNEKSMRSSMDEELKTMRRKKGYIEKSFTFAQVTALFRLSVIGQPRG